MGLRKDKSIEKEMKKVTVDKQMDCGNCYWYCLLRETCKNEISENYRVMPLKSESACRHWCSKETLFEVGE